MKGGSDNSRAFDSVVAAFERDPRVERPAALRRAFGSNGLKVDGRIFAMLLRGALVVKVPRERVEGLVRSGRGVPFDAGRGRAMKEWVMIHGDENWLELAREAREFVATR
jgi:TfoX/Sxy family transcriptional regulator of competence genes